MALYSHALCRRSFQDSACDPVSEPVQAGYIVADLGVQPKEQAQVGHFRLEPLGHSLPTFFSLKTDLLQALYEGCDALGIGDLVRPDGTRNVCSYLESEEKNPVCGTRLPDLGPKLYIARPRVQLDADGKKEFEVRSDLAKFESIL